MMELDPDQLPPRRARHRRHGDGRDDGDDRRASASASGSCAIIEMITGLRMNNALHPPRRRRPGPAPRRRSTRSATWSRRCASGLQRARGAAQREPHPQGPHRRRRLPRPHRLHGPGHHRPGAALGRPAARPAQARSPTAATRPTTSTSPPATPCDAYGRLRIRIDEMYQSLRIIEQATDRLQATSPARSWSRTRRSPGRRSWPSAATAWATASTTSARSWAPRWSP